MSKRSSQPLGDGHPEPHFWTVNLRGRQVSAQHLLQEILALAIAQFELQRQSHGPFDQAVVRHRTASLQGKGHGRDIDFLQEKIRQGEAGVSQYCFFGAMKIDGESSRELLESSLRSPPRVAQIGLQESRIILAGAAQIVEQLNRALRLQGAG